MSRPTSREQGSRGKRRWRCSAAAVPMLVGALALAAFATAASERSAIQAPTGLSFVGPRVNWSLPTFAWNRVPGADHYEFQIAADQQFNSPVLGSAGHFITRNTRATIAKLPPNGNYWWGVRAIFPSGGVSGWSKGRPFTKTPLQAPGLLSPGIGKQFDFPNPAHSNAPLLFSWTPVAGAAGYSVAIATDPKMVTLVGGRPIETSATSLAPPAALASGTYYWRVTPFDAEHNLGASSPPTDLPGRAFTWHWDSSTKGLRVEDLVTQAPAFEDPVNVNAARAFDDKQLSWGAVPGAARYELEINFSHDWSTGSRVCCSKPMTANTYSPLQLLDNNTYYWRVRPYDLRGNQGDWTEGPSFVKTFDNAGAPSPNDISPPSIKGLHVRDNLGDSGSSAPGFATSSPIVVWKPVVGASAYDISTAPFTNGYCQWSARWDMTTANTYWTPFGTTRHSKEPHPRGNVAIAADSTVPTPGHYCVRVRPVGDSASKGRVYGDYTELPDAFNLTGYALGSGHVGNPTVSYREPSQSGVSPVTPLFTWQPVSGASAYWVIVARDPSFTTLVDYAFTWIPAYAPRKTYADETTAYYWTVIPSWKRQSTACRPLSSCGGDGGDPVGELGGSRSSFNKLSTAPQAVQPQGDKLIDSSHYEPVIFQWRPSLGARNYHLQVSTDPKFLSGIIDDVTTDSTSYTSETTYPPGKKLYWRVQANDEGKIGLTWSERSDHTPYSFERQLPPPLKLANTSIGEQIPTWRWQPLPGAVSYDLHVTLPNGSTRDFTQLPTASWVAGSIYGVGPFSWKVRGEFPKKGGGTTPGPYFKGRAPGTNGCSKPGVCVFTKTLSAPTGAHALTSGGLVLAWSPKPGARSYRVQVSRTPDFGHTFDSADVETLTYAPTLSRGDYAKGGSVYWHVAAADAGHNVGNFGKTFILRLPRQITTMRPTGAAARKTLRIATR